jgi:predicted DNA-binding transcriptional regulator AlpA
MTARKASPGQPGAREDELLTVAQVLAELGGVSRRTFYRWREIGQAPAGLKLPNGEIRIWRSEFLLWLEKLREVA